MGFPHVSIPRIGMKTFIVFSFFIITMCSWVITYLTQKDAAFFCESYCNAIGKGFRYYTHNECGCSDAPYQKGNLTAPDMTKIFNK